MPTEVSQSAVLDDLIHAMGADGIDISEAIKLSPPLVLTACLLYIMAADGKIQEQESSQLQQVIGGNDGLLAHALAYVKAFPVEKFLEDAPSVLSQQDKLCIMANVCDSMLSDGNTDSKELEIFNTFREAFDLTKSEINLIIEAITLKNNKEIFGEFEPITSDKLKDLTPHLAMAVSIVYMMSADGSIGQEEIGQLESMIGEFEGLQQYALQFVRKIKRNDFLNEAKNVLDKQQKLCVLLKVCDSMMSDESVGVLEDKLFVSMMDAFSVKESSFKKYYEVLELKNIKSFDVSSFEYSIEHIRALSQQEQKGIVVEGLDDQSDVGVRIQRTMDINIEKVTNDFGSNENIQKVHGNATHALEKQRVLDIKVDPNLQKILGGYDGDKNIQRITNGSNDVVLKLVPTENRVENLQKVVDKLSDKLNQFEAKNKSLLNNVRANANKDAAKEPSFAKQASEANKATVAKEAIKDNKQPIALATFATNKAGVAKEAIEDNLQFVPVQPELTNDARVAKVAFSANRQPVSNSGQILDSPVAAKSVEKALSNDNSEGLAVISATSLASQSKAELDISTHQNPIESIAEIETAITFKNKQSTFLNIFRNTKPSKYSFKLYARVLATFLVMSLWTSNIAATRLDMGSMVFGYLLRISSDQ